MHNVVIHQIYYNDSTRTALDPNFIELDNSHSERPDWHEFWPILNFLQRETLEEGAWYGFLSPAFAEKTGLDGHVVLEGLSRIAPETDVALFSPHLSDLALFRNIFEQGERSHPGLTAAMDAFLAYRGLTVDWSLFTNCLLNSVYSNYVVARKSYWDAWRDLAESYLRFCDNPRHNSEIDQSRPCTYKGRQVPLRVFIQERLSALVLQNGTFRVFVPEQNLMFIRYPAPMRRLLIVCDTLKQTFLETRDTAYLEAFERVRQFLL